MTISEVLLLDFDSEAASTKRVLERVPDDKVSWKPHEKSMSLGTLAGHVASLPAFGRAILTTPQLDMAVDKFPQYSFTTAEATVGHAAGVAAELRSALSNLDDEALLQKWSLLYGGRMIAAAPRNLLYRTMFFNHLVHHRGQLAVYLRLLDVAVPGIYGPSADEPFQP